MLTEQDLDNNQEVTIAEIVGEQSDNIQLQDLRRLAEHVQEYQKLKHVIHNGFHSHCHELPDEYLIPIKMHRDILTLLHNYHQGTVRTRRELGS